MRTFDLGTGVRIVALRVVVEIVPSAAGQHWHRGGGPTRCALRRRTFDCALPSHGLSPLTELSPALR